MLCLNTSRMIRLTRLRQTALPTAFGTLMQNLRVSASDALCLISRNLPLKRSPVSVKSRSSISLFNRNSLPNLRLSGFSRDTWCQTLATLGTTAFQNGPAVACQHPLPKTVVVEPFSLRWLKSPFHLLQNLSIQDPQITKMTLEVKGNHLFLLSGTPRLMLLLVVPIFRNMKKLNAIGAILPALVVVLLFASCGDDRPTDSNGDGYTVSGLLFYNCQTGSSLAYFQLLKEGSAVTGASIKVNDRVLLYQSNGVYAAENPLLNLVTGDTATVEILDPDGNTLLDERYPVPDTFSVEVVSPANRLYTSGFVLVDFTPSALSGGYIVTVDPADTAEAAAPFAQYVTSGVTSTQIGPEAFQESDGTEVPGQYDIYILAYNGTFISIQSAFFPLPSQLPTGNVDEENLTGTIGVGTLSKKDYVLNTKL